MQPTTTITCKNCGNIFTGKYCNACGEKVYTEHDKSITHFLEEGFHFVSHFDGLFFNTVRTIFSSPGKLSLDYCNGRRKPYFKPLSFFLLLVVLYLLFPVFEGLNMQLRYYFTNALYGNFAQHKAAAVMAQHHLSAEQLSEHFHQKAEKVSKFMLVVIIPLTALFFWAFTFRRRKYFFDQMVFSAEVNSVYLLWGFLLLPLLLMVVQRLYHYFSGHYIPLNDDFSGAIINLPFAIFVAIASRKFYGIKRWQSIGLAIVFIIAHEFIIHVVYKFLLFVTVINQIH